MENIDTDRVLINRAQAGDEKAFDILTNQYRRKLERLLSSLIHDPAAVNLVAQETIQRAFRALPSFRGECAFCTWLYRIGVDTAKSHSIAQEHQ